MLMDEQNEMLWWNTPSSPAICSQFPGTNGEYFDKVTEQSILHFYSDDLCASEILKFDSVDNSFGFEALKFVSYPEPLGGSCFATSANLPAGAIDVKGCQRGLPFVMSNPHFYNADSSYHDQVQGLRQDATKHQSYFIIEPVILHCAVNLAPEMRTKRFVYSRSPACWSSTARNINLTLTCRNSSRTAMLMDKRCPILSCHCIGSTR